MKRLIISVLMLMAATLIFSQAKDSVDDNASKQEVVSQKEIPTTLG
ncbi:hypothetical protein SAMN04487989_105153 [Bizionia echini]|uniref:Uncharacterized protein n=1 Tax=Bizionia echini TaxID=649333 RepID=A0A1I5CLX7_9FLAO|nr:hypothetical protein [Bizionia echini]SFN87876.1 hypothetical protein SAMN04487989_105153 [Bizionia echini]